MSIVLTPSAGGPATSILQPRLFPYVTKDPSLLWPLRAQSRREDLFLITPPRTAFAKARASLRITTSLDYALYPDIVEYILSLTDHETRIRCRSLSRSISELLDYTLGHSITLRTLQIASEPAVVLRSSGEGRLPGLPPQSYDPEHASFNVKCFHPEVLRHCRVLTLHNPLPKLKISTLLRHLKVHTVRDTFPNSSWPNTVQCSKYVTLAYLNENKSVSLPYTGIGVEERIINITCPRDSRATFCSIVGPLRLSPTVKRLTVILNLPPIVAPEAFPPLAIDLNRLGVLDYLVNEVIRHLDIQFIVVGHDIAPPTALGFRSIHRMDRRQLEFDMYQRIMARALTDDFAMYHKITKSLKFLTFSEYRSLVGNERFRVDVIGPCPI